MLKLAQLKTLAPLVQEALDACPNHENLMKGVHTNPTILVKDAYELDNLTHVYFNVARVHYVHVLLDDEGTVRYSYTEKDSRR
jgi:hypothetical protein